VKGTGGKDDSTTVKKNFDKVDDGKVKTKDASANDAIAIGGCKLCKRCGHPVAD